VAVNTERTFFDADVRIETLIYLPGVLPFESFPDSFEEGFCENLPTSPDRELFKKLPELLRLVSGEDTPDAQAVAEALFMKGRTGFLFQAATPERRYLSGGSFLSGWGSYWTEWLYAETADDIAPVCVAWAEEMHKKDGAKEADHV
jgi:hypothetical protein